MVDIWPSSCKCRVQESVCRNFRNDSIVDVLLFNGVVVLVIDQAVNPHLHGADCSDQEMIFLALIGVDFIALGLPEYRISTMSQQNRIVGNVIHVVHNLFQQNGNGILVC